MKITVDIPEKLNLTMDDNTIHLGINSPDLAVEADATWEELQLKMSQLRGMIPMKASLYFQPRQGVV